MKTTKKIAPAAKATFVCGNFEEQRFKVATSEISPTGTHRKVEVERVFKLKVLDAPGRPQARVQRESISSSFDQLKSSCATDVAVQQICGYTNTLNPTSEKVSL